MSSSIQTPQLYEALGVSVQASSTDIARAFRNASLRLHPDRNIGVPADDLSEKFYVVSSAYAVLSDPEKKRAYDARHGVNFHSRIAALHSAAHGGATGVRPDHDESGSIDASGDAASRKRDRQDPVEEDDEEYDPTASADKADTIGTSPSVAHEQINVNHHAASAPQILWSAVPVSSRQQVQLLVVRSSPSQKWGVDCSVASIKEVDAYTPPINGMSTCLVMKPLALPHAETEAEGKPMTPASGLPRGSSAHRVVLEAVDGVVVSTVADLVRCLGVKTSVKLTLSVSALHSVRMDVNYDGGDNGGAGTDRGIAWSHFHAAFKVCQSTFRIERNPSEVSCAAVIPQGVVEMLVGARLLGGRLIHEYERHAQSHLPFAIFAQDHDVDAFAAEASESSNASLELLVSH
ncbi:DNA-J protein, putative [Bodo saltans]|uniref:DNA-J protein, putative n=1 Tax=Bodo saltans TaxID=75058 RepID=A0A0S4IV53_BODSA|nr:DNA-J protein, putative [Bodo saltans]|eukprot:CUF97845.1 DNA-J protein, putative [Bodo saltans]